jgi:4-nitrotryptophan synthase
VELTAKLPVQAAVHAFGVPEEELEFVVPRVNVIMTYWSGPQDQPVPLDDLLDHLTDLHSYAFELVQGQRGKVLPDTVIARLASSLEESKKDASVEQTIHQLVLLLIALFAPTTPGSLSSGVLSFATNPDQIERFLSDPACANNVANEVIRYNASNQSRGASRHGLFRSMVPVSRRVNSSFHSLALQTETHAFSMCQIDLTSIAATARNTSPSEAEPILVSEDKSPRLK